MTLNNIHKIFILISAICIIYSCGSKKHVVSTGGDITQTTPSTEKRTQDDESTSLVDMPWVKNTSHPLEITRGLSDRHLSVWASHGRYYDQKEGKWQWQRPYLYCTTEDLYTQTIVVPYLIPMLENAGANVFTPRERDWQKNEVIVDNDDNEKQYYKEYATNRRWEDTGQKGFANNKAVITEDNYNPFEAGSARKIKTSKKEPCFVSYQPEIPEAGEYAVYVSYQTLNSSVPDARYIVYHNGQRTVFNVNQQMGGGTWVYLGTFFFTKGCNTENRVEVTNYSKYKGTVTTDAVRFGGGMGNIERGGSVSGMARSFEGARYYAQWAGAPDSVYNRKKGTNDYTDDINTRSYMTNWLAGGSREIPDAHGKRVPIELALAVHSDAGYAKDYSSIYGSLSICTTNTNNGKLASGESRQVSKDFARALLDNVTDDIIFSYGQWNKRALYDRNYSETRCPQMQSAILETLSHQSFPDMKWGHDPNFKFTLARSIYKTILRHLNKDGKDVCVSPLAPVDIRCELRDSTAYISWSEQKDHKEPSAEPTGYIVYTSVDNNNFDNGTLIKTNSCKISLQRNKLYRFRVSAVNSGGESFKSETVSALWNPVATHTVMIVNGFQRLSAPDYFDNDSAQGFRLYNDAGVQFSKYAGWSGGQTCFDKTRIGIEDASGLGFSGNELEGNILVGNTFDYITTHAKAIAATSRYSIASCTRSAVEKGMVDLNAYKCTDLILGLEKYSNTHLAYYKTFTPELRKRLESYALNGGRLFVSGAYIGSDMMAEDEAEFLRNVLHLTYTGTYRNEDILNISGMNTTMEIFNKPNERHYYVSDTDILAPSGNAFSALTYPDGTSACVAYKDDAKAALTLAFPFECIKEEGKQAYIMNGVLHFLLNE